MWVASQSWRDRIIVAIAVAFASLWVKSIIKLNG